MQTIKFHSKISAYPGWEWPDNDDDPWIADDKIIKYAKEIQEAFNDGFIRELKYRVYGGIDDLIRHKQIRAEIERLHNGRPLDDSEEDARIAKQIREERDSEWKEMVANGAIEDVLNTTLLPYIDHTNEGTMKQTLRSMRIGTEIRDGKLYACFTVAAEPALGNEEHSELKERLSGQISDGWGENGFEVEVKGFKFTVTLDWDNLTDEIVTTQTNGQTLEN